MEVLQTFANTLKDIWIHLGAIKMPIINVSYQAVFIGDMLIGISLAILHAVGFFGSSIRGGNSRKAQKKHEKE